VDESYSMNEKNDRLFGMGNRNDHFPPGSQEVPHDKLTRNLNDPIGYCRDKHFFLFCSGGTEEDML
jgi:hypothetical protein